MAAALAAWALAVPAGAQEPSPADGPGSTAGRHVLEAPSGDSLVVEPARVRDMLQRTRRLNEILKKDPHVLYYVGFGKEVTPSDPARAYPWNAFRIRNDSVAQVETPGNYREADRAYYAYAVKRMEQLRSSPPASGCQVAMEREVEAVSAFVDGWLVARFLFGGPAYGPLDALAFARRADLLPAMLTDLGDVALGPCAESWRQKHPDRIEAYRTWYRETFVAAGRRADAGPRGDAPSGSASDGPAARRPGSGL